MFKLLITLFVFWKIREMTIFNNSNPGTKSEMVEEYNEVFTKNKRLEQMLEMKNNEVTHLRSKLKMIVGSTVTETFK